MSGKTFKVIVEDTVEKGPIDSRMPTAQTCMFQLNLPRFSTTELLRKKIINRITLFDYESGINLKNRHPNKQTKKQKTV